jgi:undecaprenyl-diphosphatase
MLQEWALGLPALHILGYVLAFLAAFLEALPAIGLFIPGQTAVVIAGFLAHTSVLSFWGVAILATAGAVLGDLVGYWVGRRYGTSFIRRPAFLEEVNELLRVHPIKTLVLGRFNSVTRAFAPFVAGANGVPFGRFMVANVVGGILWGFCWTGLGFVFGASYELARRTLEWGIILGVVLLFAGYLLYRAWRKRAMRLHEARASARATARALRERAKAVAAQHRLLKARRRLLAAERAVDAMTHHTVRERKSRTGLRRLKGTRKRRR